MRSRIIIAIFGLISLVLGTQVMIAAQTGDTPVPPAEPTLDPFPRPTDWEITVAEQVFENGRMFYLAPNQRIWVLIESEDDDTTGEWLVFANTWQEGEPELDPDIDAPDAMHQPIRGFGKLWRENEDLREALGWALDPEMGHITRYQFFEGEGSDGDMMQQPGVHALNSIYGHTFYFDEASWTWESIEPPVSEEDVPEVESTPEAESTEEAD